MIQKSDMTRKEEVCVCVRQRERAQKNYKASHLADILSLYWCFGRYK